MVTTTMPDVSILDIRLYGHSIATLTNVQGDRNILAFNEAYVADANRPILSLSFKDALGGLLADQAPTQRTVPPYFSNLLPEGALRRYLAQRAGVNDQREFFLLWALGLDLPGAVSIHPAPGEALPPGINDPPPGDKASALRFSLAGIQLKFSALDNDNKGGGLTIPAEGVGGSSIIKLPSQQFAGVPENEFSMMTLAQRIGIQIPAIKLINLADIEGLPEGIGELKGQALSIERFDRSSQGPIHAEDFAQVFGVFPEQKYKAATYRGIAKVLRSETGDADIAEFIRRLVFSTLIGNGDMHLKNWSLIYPDGRNPRLAPAYDLLSTISYIKGEDTAGLKYSRTRKMSEFSLAELQHLAGKSGINEPAAVETATKTVQDFAQAWDAEKHHLPLGKNVVEAIDAHLPTVPLYEELR